MEDVTCAIYRYTPKTKVFRFLPYLIMIPRPLIINKPKHFSSCLNGEKAEKAEKVESEKVY
jgi:hypothetical protein